MPQNREQTCFFSGRKTFASGMARLNGYFIERIKHMDDTWWIGDQGEVIMYQLGYSCCILGYVRQLSITGRSSLRRMSVAGNGKCRLQGIASNVVTLALTNDIVSSTSLRGSEVLCHRPQSPLFDEVFWRPVGSLLITVSTGTFLLSLSSSTTWKLTMLSMKQTCLFPFLFFFTKTLRTSLSNISTWLIYSSKYSRLYSRQSKVSDLSIWFYIGRYIHTVCH